MKCNQVHTKSNMLKFPFLSCARGFFVRNAFRSPGADAKVYYHSTHAKPVRSAASPSRLTLANSSRKSGLVALASRATSSITSRAHVSSSSGEVVAELSPSRRWRNVSSPSAREGTVVFCHVPVHAKRTSRNGSTAASLRYDILSFLFCLILDSEKSKSRIFAKRRFLYTNVFMWCSWRVWTSVELSFLLKCYRNVCRSSGAGARELFHLRTRRNVSRVATFINKIRREHFANWERLAHSRSSVIQKNIFSWRKYCTLYSHHLSKGTMQLQKEQILYLIVIASSRA